MAGDYVEKLEKRLGEPGVKEAVADGLRMMADGLLDYSWDAYYIGYIGYTAATAYGKLGLGIDWSGPPVLGEREERYLRVMEQLADGLKQGDWVLVQHWEKQLAAVMPSRVDTTDLVVAPELAVIVGITKVSIEELLGRSGVQYFRQANARNAAGCIEAIIESYKKGTIDRTELAEALMNLSLTTSTNLDKGNLFTWLMAAKKQLLREES